jgi:hypothetical protein
VQHSESTSSGAEPIVVRPATIERFDDIEPVINRACWCQCDSPFGLGTAGPALRTRSWPRQSTARVHGAVGLEAYPTDPGGTRRDATFSFTGFTPMFEAAGFRRVVETASQADRLPRWLMRLDLGRSASDEGESAPGRRHSDPGR